MRLAIPFKLNNDEYNDIAAEFNITFRESRNSKEKLIEFAEAYPDHRINVKMDVVDVSFLSILSKTHSDICARLADFSDMQHVKALKEKGVKFFFDHNIFPATSITTLDYLISLGVSDVYIADDLMYDMKYMKEITDSHNVNVRMILNVLPLSLPALNEATAPWFPPDVVHVLEEYIDTAEFDCGQPYDWHRFGVYYRAWFERETWHGNLNEITGRLSIDIPNDSLYAIDFIKHKVNCRKRCADANRTCNRCQSYIDLANEMDSKFIGFNKK